MKGTDPKPAVEPKQVDAEQYTVSVQLALQEKQQERYAIGDVLKLADLRATNSGDMPEHHREILAKAKVPEGANLRLWATKALQEVEQTIAEIKQLPLQESQE